MQVQNSLIFPSHWLKETRTLAGLEAYRFAVLSHALKFDTRTNLGFCMEVERDVDWDLCAKPDVHGSQGDLDVTECLYHPEYKKSCFDGVWDVSRCLEYTPLILSLPHYYAGPTFLQTNIEGLAQPNKETHEFRMDVEPVTGKVLSYRKRIQVSEGKMCTRPNKRSSRNRPS